MFADKKAAQRANISAAGFCRASPSMGAIVRTAESGDLRELRHRHGSFGKEWHPPAFALPTETVRGRVTAYVRQDSFPAVPVR